MADSAAITIPLELKLRVIEEIERGEFGEAIKDLQQLLKDLAPQETTETSRAIENPANLDMEALKSLIAKTLSDSEWEVRLAATNVLTKLPLNNHFELVKQALNDSSTAVRKACVENLSNLRPQEIEYIIETAGQDTNSEIPRIAYSQLHLLPKTKALTHLATALSSKYLSIRIGATESLAHFNTSDVQSLFKQVASDSSPLVRIAACKTLKTIGGKTAANILFRLQNDTDQEVRFAAIRDLEKLDTSDQVRLIDHALNNEDAGVKFIAAQEVGRLLKESNTQAKALLLRAMNDPDINIKIGVKGQIATTPDALSSKFLQKTLKDHQKVNLRWACSQGVGKLPVLMAVNLLKAALRSKDGASRQLAANSLKDLPWINSSTLIEQALKDPIKGVRFAAIEALDTLPIARALPLLAIATKDKDYYIRRDAIDTLGKNFSEVNVPLIIRGLDDQNELVRAKAVSYLHKLPTPIAKQQITKALSDTSLKVKKEAAISGLKLPEKDALEFLTTQDVNSDIAIRSGITRGLSNISLNHALPYLESAISDSSEIMKQMAARSIRELNNPTEEVHALIKKGLLDPHTEVKIEMIKATDCLESKEAIKLISPLFSDPEKIIRTECLKLILRKLQATTLN